MGAKSLVRKIMRTGYFWPTMQQDPAEFVKKCDSCQRYGNVQRVPGEQMMTISSPWPFVQWGIDIMGPLPQGKRQMKFLLVAIDYFMKWVEAKPLATITETKGTKFCIEKHCLQVQDSKDDHFRQRSSVRQPGIQVILLEPRHQEQVLIARTPPSQRTNRSN